MESRPRLGLLWSAFLRLSGAQFAILGAGFHGAWHSYALHSVASQAQSIELGAIVRAVHGLAARFRLTCLPRSLALCRLLRERGHPAEVKIGVRREAGQLQAHAWVELHGEVLGEKLHPDWRLLPMEQAAAVFAKAAAPTS